MIKCHKCGTLNEDDSMFCSECGEKIGKKKPSVSVSHSTVSGDIYSSSDGTTPDGSSISVEHTAVMGNIIGKKEEHNYYGNTTIVKDDTKALLTCKVCGKSILKSESFTCSSCGAVVCNDCFDSERKLCKKCIDERKERYREEFSQYDVIPVEVRKKLDSLKKQLKLKDEEIYEIENKGKTDDSDDALSAYEKRLIHDIVFGFFSNFKTIREIFREYGKDIKPKTPENLEWAYKKIESVYKKHPYNTEIAELYALFTASFSDLIPDCKPEKVSMDLPGKLVADVLYCSRHRDLPSAEKALNKLIETYDESDYELYIATAKIVYGNFMFSKTRQIDYLVMMEEGCNGVFLVDESTTIYLFYRLHRSLINEFDVSSILNRIKEKKFIAEIRKNKDLGIEDDERIIRKYADDGFASAQYILGMYLLSCGNTKDSIQYLKDSAEQGFAKAQVELGDLYCEGKVVEKDYDEAFSLYEEAYEDNFDIASERLGMCYYKGFGVDEDYDEAYDYLFEAAHNHVFNSYRELGDLIVSGKDTNFDIEEAFEWYEKAVKSNSYDKEAKKGLALCYLNGWGVQKDSKKASDLCPEVVPKFEKSESKTKKKSTSFEIELVEDPPKKTTGKKPQKATNSKVEKKPNTFDIELVEVVPKKNVTKVNQETKKPELKTNNIVLSEAEKKYLNAAKMGDAEAQTNLGICFQNGQGVAQNYEEAVKWYRKAAEQGNADAQNRLATRYYKGEGVTRNYEEAVKWFRKAAEQGYDKAQFNLGTCYNDGRGVAQNKKEAVKWYHKAAKQGYRDAQDWLKAASKEGVKKILSANSRFIFAVFIQAGIVSFSLMNILPYKFAPIVSLSLCFLLFTYDLLAGKKRLFGGVFESDWLGTLISSVILIVIVNLFAIMVYRIGYLHNKISFGLILGNLLRAVLLLPLSVVGMWANNGYGLPFSILGITDVFLLYSLYATSIDKDFAEIGEKIIPILVMAWNIYLAVSIFLG